MKSTTTDAIIPNDLLHTTQQKFPAVRYVTNGLVTNTMNNTDKERQKHNKTNTV